MHRVYRPLLLAGSALAMLLPSFFPTQAIVRKAETDELDALTLSAAGIWDDRQVADYASVASRLADRSPWDALVQELGPE
ncbi:MAG: hypothetical protein KDD47_08655, partial [Acidobacteria bacterium]|nr:hypothetical protein [Acidobacteriota bacterium]